MKISETTSYPHPVLTPWAQDIEDATFHADVLLREDGVAQQVDIRCDVTLDQPELVDLIERGDAAFGCFITCVQTGFRRLQRFGFPKGSHQFAPGALLGRVQLRPMVWAQRALSGYDPKGANAEFDGAIDIAPGQILALDDELRVDVLRPPLPSIESVFEIFASPEVDKGEFEIDLGGDRVKVLTDEETYALIQSLRKTDDATTASVMNAFFVPVVMEVLHQVAQGQDQYAQYRWFEPFRKRSELLDVDLKSPVLFTDAHVLLDHPFGSLSALFGAPESEDD
jgi:hypothetical protein